MPLPVAGCTVTTSGSRIPALALHPLSWRSRMNARIVPTPGSALLGLAVAFGVAIATVCAILDPELVVGYLEEQLRLPQGGPG